MRFHWTGFPSNANLAGGSRIQPLLRQHPSVTQLYHVDRCGRFFKFLGVQV